MANQWIGSLWLFDESTSFLASWCHRRLTATFPVSKLSYRKWQKSIRGLGISITFHLTPGLISLISHKNSWERANESVPGENSFNFFTGFFSQTQTHSITFNLRHRIGTNEVATAREYCGSNWLFNSAHPSANQAPLKNGWVYESFPPLLSPPPFFLPAFDIN